MSNDIKLHYGNGSKNELKKENKLFNFKFMHNIENGLKFCSAGFDIINDFVKFIKPINKRYYMYEYIFNKYNDYLKTRRETFLLEAKREFIRKGY